MIAPATAPRRIGITVAGRFVGPPGIGNGGYSSGRFAALVEGPAEVTLLRPVPLDRPLLGSAVRDGVALVGDDDGSIAEVRSVDPLDRIDPPVRPGLDEARASASRSPYLSAEHPFPGCFVCGYEHPDGLCVHAGPVAGAAAFAAPLDPGPSLPAEEGALATEIVWAALDCPSFPADRLGAGAPHLLGRLSAEIVAPVPSDEPSVVVGWELRRDGRKLHTASALLSPQGELLARAAALWIAPREKNGDRR